MTRLLIWLSEEFKNYFTSFGTIVEHQIMQDHSTGRSRGFGFVTFDSEQIVEDILAHGKMHELGGKQVMIGFIGRSSTYDNFIMLQEIL
jgi:hypothetical protein